MFRRRWVRRLLAILGAVIVVLGAVTIYEASTGAYAQFGAITGRNKLIGTHIASLAKAVRKEPGVTRVAVDYQSVQTAEPAASLGVRMAASASASQVASALNRANSEAGSSRLPLTSLTVTIARGSLTVIHTGVRSPDRVNASAITAAEALGRASGAAIRMTIVETGTGVTRIGIETPTATGPQLARLVAGYSETIGGLSAPKTTQWTMPGVVSWSGLAPAPALVLLSAEVADAPVASTPGQVSAKLRWIGTDPTQSTLCVATGATDSDARADDAARIFGAHPSTVGNFCTATTATSITSTHQLHVGLCAGTLTATAADNAYLAHVVAAHIPLPATIVAGHCGARS